MQLMATPSTFNIRPICQTTLNKHVQENPPSLHHLGSVLNLTMEVWTSCELRGRQLTWRNGRELWYTSCVRSWHLVEWDWGSDLNSAQVAFSIFPTLSMG
jgi:hypothetical protein